MLVSNTPVNHVNWRYTWCSCRLPHTRIRLSSTMGLPRFWCLLTPAAPWRSFHSGPGNRACSSASAASLARRSRSSCSGDHAHPHQMLSACPNTIFAAAGHLMT